MVFYFQKALKDMQSNRFLHFVTTVTIALTILIASAFGLFYSNASKVVASWEKGVRVMVYLKTDITETEIKEAGSSLKNIQGVESTEFVSRDSAFKLLKSQLKGQESLIQNLDGNPLPDSYELILSPDAKNWQAVEKMASEITRIVNVDDVEYGRGWLEKITAIFSIFKFTCISLGILFFIGSVFIVSNTIRLALYSRREEIEIMRLVGATDSFIKTPFYISGVLQGALGGIIGLIILFISFMVIASKVEQSFSTYMFEVNFLSGWNIISIFLYSIFVGWLGCYLSLKQLIKS